jgi:hypothetical protein
MMANVSKRTTIYFDEPTHRALRLKAAETDVTVSELVNAAVRRSLAEDVEDLAAFRERQDEPVLMFEDFVRELRERGDL